MHTNTCILVHASAYAPHHLQFALSRKAGAAASAQASLTAAASQLQQIRQGVPTQPQQPPAPCSQAGTGAALFSRSTELTEAAGVSAQNEQTLAAMGAEGVADAVRACGRGWVGA